MQIQDFLEKLEKHPDTIEFSETMDVIDSLYEFNPTDFSNGELRNRAGQNSGSCKLFAFAQKHGLDEQQTLACFGTYYRQDVLQHPGNDDHQNIRNFVKTGWQGIRFSANPLTERS